MSNEKSLKNPLAVALGLVLKQMREESPRAAEDIAKTLDVSPSTYRLFESGSNNLRPTYAPWLLREEAFTEIEFSPLATLLQATHSLDTLWEEKEHLLDALAELGKFDNPLQRITTELERELKTRDKLESDDVRAAILQSGLDDRLRQFLASPIFSGAVESRAELTTKRFLKEVSPFYFDTAARLLLDLKRSEPQIRAGDLGEWEEENADRMEKIRVVAKDLNVLFNEGNFEDYTFRYILNKEFLASDFTIDIIFANISINGHSTISPMRFKDMLINKLHRYYIWKTGKGKSFGRGKVDEIINNAFRLGQVDSQSIDNILDLPSIDEPYRNLWMYELSPLGNIVAIGDRCDAKEVEMRRSKDHEYKRDIYGELLDYSESVKKFSDFGSIWGSIGGGNKYNIEEINSII